MIMLDWSWPLFVIIFIVAAVAYLFGAVAGLTVGSRRGREAGLRRGARALREIAGTMTNADAIGSAHATAQILDNIADVEREQPGRLIEYEEGKVWI